MVIFRINNGVLFERRPVAYVIGSFFQIVKSLPSPLLTTIRSYKNRPPNRAET